MPPPENLTGTERIFFEYIRRYSDDLLIDLKSKGLIKKPSIPELDAFLKLIEMNDRLSIFYNKLNALVDVKYPERRERFLTDLAQLRITENEFTEMYFQIMIMGFNRQTELFRIAFLTILKRAGKIGDRTTLNPVIKYLNNVAGSKAKPITEALEPTLRNVFSHHTYWFEDHKIFYSEDSSFRNIKTMEFGEAMLKAKRQNIIFTAFVKAFSENAAKGFFSSV